MFAKETFLSEPRHETELRLQGRVQVSAARALAVSLAARSQSCADASPRQHRRRPRSGPAASVCVGRRTDDAPVCLRLASAPPRIRRRMVAHERTGVCEARGCVQENPSQLPASHFLRSPFTCGYSAANAARRAEDTAALMRSSHSAALLRLNLPPVCVRGARGLFLMRRRSAGT